MDEPSVLDAPLHHDHGWALPFLPVHKALKLMGPETLAYLRAGTTGTSNIPFIERRVHHMYAVWTYW